MKKLLSVLLAFVLALMLVPVSALADGTTVTVNAPDTLPKAGETFTVTVDISGNPGLCAAQFTLGFDESKVQCQDVSLGTVLKGMLSATNPSAKDGAIVAAAATSAKTGDGTLSVYTFKVLKSGDPGFTLTDGVFSDAAGKTVTTNVDAPVVTPPTQPTTPEQPTTPTTPTEQTTPTTPTEPTQGETTGAEQTTPAQGETQPPVEEQPTEGQPVTPEDETVTLFSAFSDVPASYWGSAYIERAVALGLINGMGDGTFAPEKNMTRAEFVSMLYRLSGGAAAVTDRGFTDVRPGDWYYNAVCWAAEKGYATGDGKTFRPNGNITRQEVVTILYRFSGASSGMETFLGAFGIDNLTNFADRGEIASWATDAMRWAIFKGLVNGTTDTTVSPNGTAKRAQVAAIFVRYAEM